MQRLAGLAIVAKKRELFSVSSPSRPSEVVLDVEPRAQLPTLSWALRRAAFGLLILVVMVVLAVWLFYASIDPDEAAASSPAQAGYVPPQR